MDTRKNKLGTLATLITAGLFNAQAMALDFTYPSYVNMPGGQTPIAINCKSDFDWSNPKKPEATGRLIVKLDTNKQIKYNPNLSDIANKDIGVNHLAGTHKICVDESAYGLIQKSPDKKNPSKLRQALTRAYGGYAEKTIAKIHHPQLRKILGLPASSAPENKAYCPISDIRNECLEELQR